MSVMQRSIPYATAFVVPALCSAAVFEQGLWLLGPPLFLFVATPLLDELLGDKEEELEADGAFARTRDVRYDAWLYLWVLCQLPLQLGALAAARTADAATLLGLTFAAGLLGGIGINVAHELMHRRGWQERALAEVLLTSVSYAHFSVEHVLGHHRHVSTPDDPASARRGEPLQSFWLRSILGGVVSAWRLEHARVVKLGIGLSLRDRRVRYGLVWLAVVAAIGLAFGPRAWIVFLGQSLIAVLLLETINYIEHYGLSRARLPDGSYERVTPHHSWCSARRLTSLYLFNLTRHADHHAHASRPYYALRHVDGAPRLPYGYAAMLVLSLVPPLWRRVMDPLVPSA